MRINKYLLMIVSASLMFITSRAYAAHSSDEEIVEEIRIAADSFDIAVEMHNFRLAKKHLNVLFPLIKKEMKMAKKRIAEFGKMGDKAAAKREKKLLKRKEEINSQLHAFVDDSSAALRVKSASVKTLVTEYVAIMQDQSQWALADSN